MDWIPLNVFQHLTRQWEEIHPYNAAQVMRLAGRPDHEQISATWQSTLDELKMAWFETDRDRYRWRLRNPAKPPPSPIFVPSGTTFDQFMSDQLNLRFDPADGQPFRPFVIEDGDSYLLGVVYHHWVADSYSIRLLMREWFFRMFDPAAARRKPFKPPEGGYWELFGPHARHWSIWGSTLTMLRWGTRFGRARRIGARKFAELQTDFTFRRGPDGLIDAIGSAARASGATVNDLFLAAMALVCRDLLPLDGTVWRRELALGTIVDLRAGSQRKLAETFGLFLGFTTVFCRPEELASPKRLIRAVNQQIRAQKESHSAEASMMRMVGTRYVTPLLSRKRLMELYRKRFGMTAGISNVNLNRDWPSRYSPSPLMEYIRVSPCGSLMPIVFTPTTLGSSLGVGVSCRRSIIPEAGIQRLADRFIEHLQAFAEGPVTNLPTLGL